MLLFQQLLVFFQKRLLFRIEALGFVRRSKVEGKISGLRPSGKARAMKGRLNNAYQLFLDLGRQAGRSSEHAEQAEIGELRMAKIVSRRHADWGIVGAPFLKPRQLLE